MENIKTEIINLLRQTNREGIDNVIKYLEASHFFTDPASCNNHYNFEGGLAKHSYNVMRTAIAIRKAMIEIEPSLEQKIPESSVIICSLLHDICKVNKYVKAKKWKKNEKNQWESYDSWEIGEDKFPIGHGEKSVIMLLTLGLKMSADEMLAIRWHMGIWDIDKGYYETVKNFDNATNQSPLVCILQTADNMSTHVVENID